MFDGGWALVLAHDPAEGADQVPQFDFVDRLARPGRAAAAGQSRWPAGETLLPGAAMLFEHAGRVLELLVLQQPPHQVLPRVVELLPPLRRRAAAPSAT